MSATSLALPIDDKFSLHRRDIAVQHPLAHQKLNYQSINPDENPIILSILLLSIVLVLLASIVVVNKLLEIEREKPYDPALDSRSAPSTSLTDNKAALWNLPHSSSSNPDRKSYFAALFQQNSFHNNSTVIDQKQNIRKSLHSVISRAAKDESADDAYIKLKQELVSDMEYRTRDSFVSEAPELDNYSNVSNSKDFNMDKYQETPSKERKTGDSKKRMTTFSTFSVMTSDSLL